jgi:hypothetical protein
MSTHFTHRTPIPHQSPTDDNWSVDKCIAIGNANAAMRSADTADELRALREQQKELYYRDQGMVMNDSILPRKRKRRRDYDCDDFAPNPHCSLNDMTAASLSMYPKESYSSNSTAESFRNSIALFMVFSFFLTIVAILLFVVFSIQSIVNKIFS